MKTSLFSGRCRVWASEHIGRSCLLLYFKTESTVLRIDHPTNGSSSDEHMWATICVSADLSLEALLTPVPAFSARPLWPTCSRSERTLVQWASHHCAACVAWVCVISVSVDICWGIKEHVARCHFISCSGACSAGQGVEEGRSTEGITTVTRQMFC